MDSRAFDHLSRAVYQFASRRAALRLGGSAGLAMALPWERRRDDDVVAAKHNTGNKTAKRKKRRKRQAPAVTEHPGTTAPPPCTPECTDKECGSDGCGGACGDCSGGICQINDQCANGSLVVGDQCDPGLPRACSSGVCGCVGQTCTCRSAGNCLPTGMKCSELAECCTGPCGAGGGITVRKCRKADCGDPQVGAPCQVDTDCCAGGCLGHICSS